MVKAGVSERQSKAACSSKMTLPDSEKEQRLTWRRFRGRFQRVIGSVAMVLLGVPVAHAGVPWDLVVGDGHGPGSGFGDPDNGVVASMVEFGGELFLGVGLNASGCEVWRSGDGVSWVRAVGGGFGDANNLEARSMVAYGDRLYVGTFNSSTGTEVWRTSDGAVWEQVNADGYGDGLWGTDSMAVFQGKLYASTTDISTGTEIWRFDGVDWVQVNSDGFGNPYNGLGRALTVFDGGLYVGTESFGAEIWRTTDGTTWTMAAGSGFGGLNSCVTSMSVFEDRLYAGTFNTIDGCEVWRSHNGTDWENVVLAGFSDHRNMDLWWFEVFGGALYAATGNYDTAQQQSSGSEIWRTTDGVRWSQVNGDGFGDPVNEETRSMAAFSGALYAGVGNPFDGDGCEVWRLPLIFADGFESDDLSSWSAAIP